MCSRKIVTVCIIACLSVCALSGQDKVLLILKDGSENIQLMLKKEVGVVLSMLREAGYQPVVATASGATLGAWAVTLTPDLKLDQVDITDYVAVIVPCMALGKGFGVAKAGVDLVSQAYDLMLPIAAQDGGVEFLAKAGIMKGKHFSIGSGDARIVPGGIYDGSRASVDGLIITSGTCPFLATTTTPDTTADLMSKLIELLQQKSADTP